MMTLNPYIQTAFESFEKLGESFHHVMLWHISHGLVLVSPEFLAIGYYCAKSDTGTPVQVAEADTVFVTFMAGDMNALKRVSPGGIQYICFKRGMKNHKGDQIYDIEKFKTLIH